MIYSTIMAPIEGGFLLDTMGTIDTIFAYIVLYELI